MPCKIQHLKKTITLKKSDMSYVFSNVQEIPYKRHNYTVYPKNTVKQHRFKPSQVPDHPDNRPSSCIPLL